MEQRDRSFYLRVKKYIEDQKLLSKGDHIVLGVSGGADSVCLLCFFIALQKEWELSLQAVHINHGIRGIEADRDEQFVRSLCEQYDVPLVVYHENIPMLAKKHAVSEEEAGRHCRYEIFRAERKKRMEQSEGSFVWIAVAHHRNDQAETVLHQLCRGSDISGLRGMRAKQGDIIRPFLCVGREEIESCLDECGQAYCLDSTNASNEYTRNYLRNEILPALVSKVNTETIRHIAETAQSMGELEEFLICSAKDVYKNAVEERKEGELFLKKEKIEQKHPVVQRAVVKMLLTQCAGENKNIDRRHIMNTIELMKKQVGKSIRLPYHMVVHREHGGLLFLRENAKNNREHLSIENKGVKPECRLMVMDRGTYEEKRKKYYETTSGKRTQKKHYTNWFDYDKIVDTVCLRRILQGDYCKIDCAGHHKAVKKICKDAKISAREREQLWVLAEENHVLWIPGVRVSEYYKVTEKTDRILQVDII